MTIHQLFKQGNRMCEFSTYSLDSSESNDQIYTILKIYISYTSISFYELEVQNFI